MGEAAAYAGMEERSLKMADKLRWLFSQTGWTSTGA